MHDIYSRPDRRSPKRIVLTPQRRAASNTETQRISLAIAIPFSIGLVFMVAAIVVIAPTVVFLAKAKSTAGTYVGSVSRVGGNHAGTFLYPQFAFRTSPGQPVRVVTSSSGSTDQPYGEGAKVRILYDSAHPEKAVVPSFLTLWAGPTLFAVIGLGFVIPALSVAISRRKAQRLKRSAKITGV